MAINPSSSVLLRTQLQATAHQARQMGYVAGNFARFGLSLVRLPILICQTATLVLATPFVGLQALTGLLDRSTDRMERALDSRLTRVTKPKPAVLPKPAATLTSTHSPAMPAGIRAPQGA